MFGKDRGKAQSYTVLFKLRKQQRADTSWESLSNTDNLSYLH